MKKSVKKSTKEPLVQKEVQKEELIFNDIGSVSNKLNIVSPYRNIKQYTRISIEPHHMNSNIKNNMKYVLKKKVEKKCNKYGYVSEVYRILEYSDGIMPTENLNANAIYDITYHCKLCIPIENTCIVCNISVISPEIIFGHNGPLLIMIRRDNIDMSNWNISDGIFSIKANRKLQSGDYCIVKILEKRINQDDSQIKLGCQLVDLASEEQVLQFFGSTIVEQNEKQSIVNKEETEDELE
jgi:DNA-directed RNA polymerase subunit E'/Rpb7